MFFLIPSPVCLSICPYIRPLIRHFILPTGVGTLNLSAIELARSLDLDRSAATPFLPRAFLVREGKRARERQWQACYLVRSLCWRRCPRFYERFFSSRDIAVVLGAIITQPYWSLRRYLNTSEGRKKSENRGEGEGQGEGHHHLLTPLRHSPHLRNAPAVYPYRAQHKLHQQYGQRGNKKGTCPPSHHLRDSD